MSYYDDPDFAEEYRRRDEEALDWYLREREEQDEAIEKAFLDSLKEMGVPVSHGKRL